MQSRGLIMVNLCIQDGRGFEHAEVGPILIIFDNIILPMGQMFQVRHLGVPLTMFYFFCSNWALGLMGVAPDVREMAASYARIRGVFQPVLLDLTRLLHALLRTCNLQAM
jgi:alkylation response protein AidB-like acyl-CoA dehydrogenase